MKRSASSLVLLLGVTLVAGACSVLEPKPDTSRYFLLQSAATGSSDAPLEDLVLGLGPVTLPDYLDRNEMLDVVGPYELSYSSQNRWVEPLGRQIRRTLADNLRGQLSPDAILHYPWFENEGVTLQVEVTLDAMRRGDSGAWVGSGEWVLRDSATGSSLDRADISFEISSDTSAPEQRAADISAELERLSVEIAEAVRRHHQ